MHPHTWQCLRIAAALETATGGAFDVAYAVRRHFGPVRLWELDPHRPAVRALAPGVSLDLAGIGKGFALDRLAALLAHWDVNSALWDAGGSTVLAGAPPGGQPGGAVRLGDDPLDLGLVLCGRAIPSSGTDMRGYPIVHPQSGQPVRSGVRVWVLADTAAEADALSTAL